MSCVLGRARSNALVGGAAAVASRAARVASAMTGQWYTNRATETSDAMKIRELGHVSLFVRDLDATRRFYHGVLGLTETGTGKDGRIVFFSAGVHHHDLSCELTRADGPGPQPKGVPGLYHIAFDVGSSAAELVAARRHVESHGLTPFGEYARGFCVHDPDGHEIELYVNVGGPEVAPRTPQRSVAPRRSRGAPR
jgi:catechol 2,3-dioxygenase